MEVWLTICYLLITIITIIICFFWNKTQLKTPKKLNHFSKNYKFKEYSNETDISNQISCNAETLKKCKLDNPSDLYGCKEFYVSCQHFDKDVLVHVNKEIKTIPKNSNKNEGYALPITAKTKEQCNLYHGDLTLVARSETSDEYMLICQCKKPGYIGNDHILGNCTTVRICDSKIDNINQELEKINCICPPTHQSARNFDQSPICKPLTIVEANEKFADWSDKINWSDKQTIPTSTFNKTIQDNMNVKSLLNPCLYSILDTSINIPNSSFDMENKTCVVKDFGLPVRNGNFQKTNKTYSLDDGTIVPYNQIDGIIHTEKYKALRFIDRIQGKNGKVHKRITLNTRLPFYKNKLMHIVLKEPTTLGENLQLMITTKNQLIAGKCKETNWYQYSCEYSESYYNRFIGLPRARYEDLSDSHLWGYETWYDFQKLNLFGSKVLNTGFNLYPNYYLLHDQWLNYGFKFCEAEEANCLSGFLRANNKKDYDLHKKFSF